MTFEVLALRLRLMARRAIRFPRPAANLLRGRLGKSLKARGGYERWFAPKRSTGPSGLHDPPRPFVLRAGHLDGIEIDPGVRFSISVNWFDLSEDPVQEIAAAFADFATIEHVDCERLRFFFEPALENPKLVRLRFLSPTELKGADTPEFGALFARIRDRISTLRALYQGGPLEVDFKAMGERAERVRMTCCDLKQVAAERISRGTGQRHSLGGFTGIAEYQGELAEFVPYLHVAQWTGVGRQTVWGKGEIAVEIL